MFSQMYIQCVCKLYINKWNLCFTVFLFCFFVSFFGSPALHITTKYGIIGDHASNHTLMLLSFRNKKEYHIHQVNIKSYVYFRGILFQSSTSSDARSIF